MRFLPVEKTVARASHVGVIGCLLLIAGSLVSLPVSAQSLAQNDNPVSFGEIATNQNPFTESNQAKLFDEVLEKLRKMRRDSSSQHDNSVREDEDWFVVGGTLTHPTTGYLEANFNAFQGVDDVARRIVEFQYGNYSGRIASWRVFHRTGDEELAKVKTDQLFERYGRWFAAQVRKQKEMQLAAQQRSTRNVTRRRSSGGRRC